MQANRVHAHSFRKSRLLYALGFFFLASVSNAAQLSCEESFRAFLHSPSSSTQKALEKGGDDDCWWRVSKMPGNFTKLTEIVASGNDMAADFLASRLSSNEGVDLEDALIGLGLYSDKKMQRFMSFVVNKKLSEGQFSSSIASLPLTLTDDFIGQVSAIAARRCAAGTVSDPKLSRAKTIALTILDERIKEIRRAELLLRGTQN